jgi:hypothetical protein
VTLMPLDGPLPRYHLHPAYWQATSPSGRGGLRCTRRLLQGPPQRPASQPFTTLVTVWAQPGPELTAAADAALSEYRLQMVLRRVGGDETPQVHPALGHRPRIPNTASVRITSPHSTSATAGWVRISEFSSREENIGGEQRRISDRVAAISAD